MSPGASIKGRSVGRWRWALLAAALLLTGGGLSWVGAGDALAAPPGKDRARSLFFKGLKAFAQGNYPDALAHFTASYKIKPKSIVLYNIAMCHKALFQYTKAIAAFREYLGRRSKKLPLWKRRQIERSVELMERKLGRVKLMVHPEGATIRVDGRVVGRAPLSGPLGVDPGRRVVEISLGGYRTVVLQLTVVASQPVSMGVRLQPHKSTGKLVITSRVRGATARLDGRPAGSLPVVLDLPPGEHRVRVSASGYSSRELKVQVRPGETVRHDVGLIPLGADRAPATSVARKWWFWTILSVAVVAAGVTTGVLLWDKGRGTEAVDFTWQLR
ncbi:MAG: PEGA domain-containing protein [bacterium]